MGEAIHRDATVAGEAIRYALITDAFTTEEILSVSSPCPPRDDVVRTLQELERRGWLARDEADDTVWVAGPRAQTLRCEEIPLSTSHLCDRGEA
ncbi:hypothetical protein AUR64_17950 [Haloprofundus marisrubri]|uniref:MarR family transcriptional regulator n=1 Tax=Haloprofundus marisrubri TaxID=1514971 RepID=A0A0W1R662_9EURY|nr:hypothetical protein [Haloprofundus marisrubri]KTG08559.1 hypothetical protein AUR64_17950 [Haloprofundus marisrubri]